MKTTFIKESFFSLPRRELFAFHERPEAFTLLTPAWQRIEVESTASTLRPSGDVVRFAVRFGPLRFPFEMIHTDFRTDELFVDQQQGGLFSSWRHEHRFLQAGWDADPASVLQDRITYAHPLLPLLRPFVAPRLATLFQFRHRKTAEELSETMKRDSAQL